VLLYKKENITVYKSKRVPNVGSIQATTTNESCRVCFGTPCRTNCRLANDRGAYKMYKIDTESLLISYTYYYLLGPLKPKWYALGV